MNVLVVGGGVVGSACAYYLSRAGAQVTLIDKGRIGHGCSYGNAGMICPSHAFPLPMPGAITQALKWMLKRDSPLYIKPRLSLEMAWWLLRFLRYSNRRHMHRGSAALLSLAQYSLGLFEELDADAIAFRKDGLLYACNSDEGMHHASAELELMQRSGLTGRVLDADETRKLNPALTGPLVGSVFYENEAHAEPLRVVQEFARLAEANGATVLPNTELFEFETDGDRITAVHTTSGRMIGDQYVLALGSWSPPIAKQLGLRVPIQAGKGYAITVDALEPAVTVPTLLAEKKIGVTPRDGSVRLAGTMELAGLDESISPHRVHAIARGARAFMNLPDDYQTIEVWRGLRPCTPDGLPLIGRPAKWSNLHLAAGHAMLGLTLSTGTGKLIADMITGGEAEIDASRFDPNRTI